jgi:hypothetical protein
VTAGSDPWRATEKAFLSRQYDLSG